MTATRVGGILMAPLLWVMGRTIGPTDPSDLVATIRAEDTFDASAELHRITAPTLVIGCERDRLYAPELFWETARRIRGARLRLYRGKGHIASQEKPVNREILSFLTIEDRL